MGCRMWGKWVPLLPLEAVAELLLLERVGISVRALSLAFRQSGS